MADGMSSVQSKKRGGFSVELNKISCSLNRKVLKKLKIFVAYRKKKKKKIPLAKTLWRVRDQ